MKKVVITLIALFLSTINLHATDIDMVDTDGKAYKVVANENEIKIEGMEGKVVFMQFFGLNCPACKQEMPHLINIQNMYPNKLQIMAIEVQKHDNDPIKAFKKEHGINYTTFSNFDIGYMVRYIAEKSGWKGMIPFMLVIDSKGQVQFTQRGIVEEDKLKEYIEKFSK